MLRRTCIKPFSNSEPVVTCSCLFSCCDKTPTTKKVFACDGFQGWSPWSSWSWASLVAGRQAWHRSRSYELTPWVGDRETGISMNLWNPQTTPGDTPPPTKPCYPNPSQFHQLGTQYSNLGACGAAIHIQTAIVLCALIIGGILKKIGC